MKSQSKNVPAIQPDEFFVIENSVYGYGAKNDGTESTPVG